jgi:hypothetical protein
MPEEPMMTEAQRDELKTLCQKADVPDKLGEMHTQEGAQHWRNENNISLRKVRQAPVGSTHEGMNPPSLARRQSAHPATKLA